QGVSSADLVAGMWAVIGVLAALRERDRTGTGQWVDISLLDGSLSWLTYVAGGHFATGENPRRYGSAHPTIAPYQAFTTEDGYVMVAVGNDGLWRRFAPTVGLGELADDERFRTNPLRVEHRDALIPLIEKAMSARPTGEWVRLLDEVGVPVGPIQTVEEVLHDPQVLARGMISQLEHPTAGTLWTIGCPVRLSATPPAVRTPPPLLGQHTDDVLAELGFSAATIAALH
ncbi:MAG: CaiB/BaiF CoA transferase family protein, partial [Acidimicrobiales bacterium]